MSCVFYSVYRIYIVVRTLLWIEDILDAIEYRMANSIMLSVLHIIPSLFDNTLFTMLTGNGTIDAVVYVVDALSSF